MATIFNEPKRRAGRYPSILEWLLGATLLLALGVSFGFPLQIDLDAHQMRHRSGNAYSLTLSDFRWPLLVESDQVDATKASELQLFENGRELKAAHVSLESIRLFGGGRYSHWQGMLYFSASDNSDPRTNGNRYLAIVPLRLHPDLLLIWFLTLAVVALATSIRWLFLGLIAPRDFLLPLGSWSALAGLLAITPHASGSFFWLCLGANGLVLTWAYTATRREILVSRGYPSQEHRLAQSISVSIVSITLVLVGAELLLKLLEQRALTTAPIEVQNDSKLPTSTKAIVDSSRGSPLSRIEPSEVVPRSHPLERLLESFGVEFPQTILQAALSRSALLTLPPELERRPVQAVGAVRAYEWHGVLHVQDINSMRRTTAFPDRKEHVFRIVVVGDSLTYGEGIDIRWTYPRQLEELLSDEFEIEVLNLGVSGQQSGDIVNVLRKFLDELDPQLVIYGVCNNDFLDSGVGQYRNNYAFELPLADSTKKYFTERSRVARLSEDAYNRLLLAIGLRADFFDDILRDFSAYQERFFRDVTTMNKLVVQRGSLPVIALVLDQYPVLESTGHQIAVVAEGHLERAGMHVIKTDAYYRHFDGHSLRVSRWEGHPNEIANAIWANMLKRHLTELPALERFRIHREPMDPSAS